MRIPLRLGEDVRKRREKFSLSKNPHFSPTVSVKILRLLKVEKPSRSNRTVKACSMAPAQFYNCSANDPLSWAILSH